MDNITTKDNKIGFNAAEPTITIHCKCGATLDIKGNEEWDIDLTGVWVFKHNCGFSIEIPNEEMIAQVKKLNK